MYSIVLMAALTTGGEVPDFGGRRCHGCYGGGYCSGYGGGGCYGGNGGFGCHGCYGGWARYGGWGGCYGGWGGCYGGWGGCYGGCYGGGYGCYGGGCYGGGYYGGGYRGWASAGSYNPTGMYYTDYGSPVVYTARAAKTARLIVNLPADAKLTVDDTPTTQTSSQRVFTSPPLEPGRMYHYTLRAELMRDGQRLTATRQVTVQAGRESAVTLEPTTATSASQ
jgi:uncharacterized protein (TIGR03000 family)